MATNDIRRRKPRGSKYDKAVHPDRAHGLALLGYIDVEIAAAMGISESTLYNWKRRHLEFSTAIECGREPIDVEITQALHKKAKGGRMNRSVDARSDLTVHVTGNLVIRAAHLVSGGEALVAPMLSVPVFVSALGLTRLLVGRLERIGFASLRPLLPLQLLLLAGFFVLCVSADPHIDPGATRAIVAGMLGVSAMAVQNALAQISLRGGPSTAVMTTNTTRFMMVGEVMLGRELIDIAKARSRAMHTWPAIVGFAVGCGLGAACEAAIGLRCLALPTGLALLAFARGLLIAMADRVHEPR